MITPLNELTPREIAEVGKVSKIMIRRLKEDVLDDLPEKIDIHTALTPSAEEVENITRLFQRFEMLPVRQRWLLFRI